MRLHRWHCVPEEVLFVVRSIFLPVKRFVSFDFFALSKFY